MAEIVAGDVDSQLTGTTGEPAPDAGNDPAAGANGGTQGGSVPDLDEGFLKQLDGMDPTRLPQSFLDRFVPKPEFTRKTQDFSERIRRAEAERENALELARRIAGERTNPQGPTPEDLKRKELEELALSGDAQALREVVRMDTERQVQPIQAQVALQQATVAAQSNPIVGQAVQKHWGEIVQTINQDPTLSELVRTNNHAYAEKVMIALGIEHHAREIEAAYKVASQENAKLKERVATLEKERNAGLPPSTSKAGTTSGRVVSALSDDEQAKAAWTAAGGRIEDFF